MSGDSVQEKEIKHTLRKLKHLEANLASGTPPCPGVLIWDRFFDLKQGGMAGKAKYNLRALAGMNRAQFKAVIDEYWAFVYAALFAQGDAGVPMEYDAATLLRLGLPHDADEQAVKKRFRELAKRYHPDTGGDAQQFIDLMAAYRKLLGR